ncbi:MAG: PilT/PilU family type 4a pilus ATPase [Actinobacteria bacterium]|nr:PilT/PilU family type 4a pilus ATPase [Actinomycetota bacterium]
MTQAAEQLGKILVERNVLSADDLARHAAAAAETGAPLAQVLAERLPAGRETVLRVAAERLGMGFYRPGTDPEPSLDALRVMERSMADEHVALPVAVSATEVHLAMADPFDRRALAAIHKITGFRVVPLLAAGDALPEAISAAYARLEQQPAARPAPGGGRIGVAEADMHVNDLLLRLVEMGGSDLHLTAGTVPQVRVDGRMIPLDDAPRLTPQMLQMLVYSMLTGDQREKFEDDLELDFSHPIAGTGRFRVNAFFQRGSVGAVMRAIPDEVPSLEDLNMPAAVRQFAGLPRGLVLVTGATGSGKSTTLASLVDLINETRAVHIMTVEDPIEFLHRHKRAIVNQREVGQDTTSFSLALRQALRQDPDVILVGELRDLETMSTALTAAETGHLVFATLHTQSAALSVERMIDVFPSHQQQQVRVQLAGSLQGIVTQQLLPTIEGTGRIAAVEVLVATAAMRNLIREGKQHQITSLMQSGGKHGMQTMDQALAMLVRSGRVAMKDAEEQALDVAELRNLTGRA